MEGTTLWLASLTLSWQESARNVVSDETSTKFKLLYCQSMSKAIHLTTVVSIAVSLVLYSAALILPALEFKIQPPVRGITTLLWGWWGLLSFDFPWLANPVYAMAIGFFCLGKKGAGLKFTLAAIVLGSLSFFVRNWYFSEAEATPVLRLGSGFYCWIGSFVVLLAIYASDLIEAGH